MKKCYGYGQVGYFLVNCPVVICLCCDGEGHIALECPWNPKAHTLLLVKWDPVKRPRMEPQRVFSKQAIPANENTKLAVEIGL